MTDDLRDFEKLVAALRPWLPQLVIVGGWAHRLHHEHPHASRPSYQPLRTRDADVAFGATTTLAGKISEALAAAGFREELSSDETPPIVQYTLGSADRGFYVEFLTPLTGSSVRRDGSADSTVARAGITAQKLRHVEVLLTAPWPITMGGGAQSALADPVSVHVTNPSAFLAQKLLIHPQRKPPKQAQDILYIHDTLQLFGASWDTLAALWVNHVRPALTRRQFDALRDARSRMFAHTSDAIRAAARIPVDRALRPDDLRAVCELGLATVLVDG